MRHFDRRVVNEFIFDARHRLVYCPIPKVASTSMKMVMQRLAGIDPDQVSDAARRGAVHDASRNGLSYLMAADDKTVAKMLTGRRWFRFVVVRNPWTRLVSAYRSKVEAHPRRLQDPAYMDNPDRVWVGKLIDDIEATHGEPTFPHFVRYTAGQDPATMNMHYRPQVLLSGFADIEFSFVARIETLPSDYPRMMAAAEVADPPPLATAYEVTAADLVNDYYDPETLDLVAKTYRDDISAFGYSHPA